MTGWAKIEIEFQPETHDPSEVMLFLAEHFRTEQGIPTANIVLVEIGMEVATATWPWPKGMGPRDPEVGADAIWEAHKPQPGQVSPGSSTIQAIKEMRSAYNLGLKESKDYIDAARKRNP